MTFMYITNNPQVALIAEKYGVERIWVDLESLGKDQRQKGMNTVKSKHRVEDIRRIAPLLSKAEMLVRINPWNPKSEREIEQVISAGADRIMLPMWKSADEVENFLSSIEGKVKNVLLLETREAEECLEEVLALKGIDEIHIGLNDLSLSYGLPFMFELLSNGTVERICRTIKAQSRIPYGFGGIARIGEGILSSEKIIMEHYRLGSTRVILSRSFCNTDTLQDISEIEAIFCENIMKLRKFEREEAAIANPPAFYNNKKEIADRIQRLQNNVFALI